VAALTLPSAQASGAGPKCSLVICPQSWLLGIPLGTGQAGQEREAAWVPEGWRQGDVGPHAGEGRVGQG
jgi:hypothetical protein